MKTPHAIFLGLALVATAIAVNKDGSVARAAPFGLPSFLAFPSGENALAWRLDTETGQISLCTGNPKEKVVCTPWTEKEAN